MHKILSVFFSSLFLSLQLFAAGQDVPWKYMVLERESDSIPAVKKLSSLATIRNSDAGLEIFTGSDTVVLPVNEGLKLYHLQKNAFQIQLIPPHESYGLQGLPAEVKTPAGEMVANCIVDSLGIVVIDDLNPGDYSVSVNARNRGLVANPCRYNHNLEDRVGVKLKEDPVKPYNISANSIFSEDEALFSSDLIWNNDTAGLGLPYTYLIGIDGARFFETDQNEFLVDSLSAGRHTVHIKGKTPLGVLTELARYSFSLDYPASDFKIHLVADEEGEMPLEGIAIRLRDEESEEFITPVILANESGDIKFRDLPPGKYSLQVDDPAFPFYAPEDLKISHGFRDEMNIRLQEEVASLRNLRYDISLARDGKYDLTFLWDRPEEEYFTVPLYIYLFMNEDGYIGETSEFNFILEDLEEGHYEFCIYSLSHFGNLSGCTEVAVDLNAETAGVTDIREAGDDEWLYYNLNGQRVNPDNLYPGIYVKTRGGISEKIVMP